jgi:hypothetical protein
MTALRKSRARAPLFLICRNRGIWISFLYCHYLSTA